MHRTVTLQAGLLGVLALAATALVGTAGAQMMILSAKFTLPFAVNWGGVTLRPGDYSLTMERHASVAKVRSAAGEVHFIPTIPTVSASRPGGAFLLVTTTRQGYVVRYLNLPKLGETLIYAPLRKTEQEEIARGGQAQAIPVTVAQN